MSNSEENQRTLNDLYRQSISHRLCSTKKEFAELIGASRQVVSSALNGDPTYATDSLVVKASRALEGACANISMVNNDSATGNVQKNFGTSEEDVRHIVDRLVDEMAKQRESYERIILAAIQNSQK